MTETIRLALVDDDEAALNALGLYFARKGVATACYSSGEAFLAAIGEAVPFDCVVTDLSMPGLSGAELLQKLLALPAAPPILLISGHGDIDTAVAAIKAGAADFLEKPFDEERLYVSIRTAVKAATARRAEQVEIEELRARTAGLSPRQREVMELAAAGLSGKEIGQRLGISPRTVENHRAWLMQRLGTRNLAELIRIATRLQ